MRKLLTTLLQIFFIFLLITYLIVNTVLDIARTKLVYTSLSFETASELPPPAFTLCSDDVKYTFNCTIYGNVTKGCSGLITPVDVSKDENYNGWFTQCYVFQTTESLISQEPKTPPKQWTAFQSPFFIRYALNNASTISKMNLMVWNPFLLPSTTSSSSKNISITAAQILSPYQITQMDACRERVFTFYWRKHVFLNGSEKWDVDWRAEFGVASNAFGTNMSAIGVIHFKPGTFEIPTTREYRILPVLSIITTFLVLLAALYSTYYAILCGRGKYRIWGLAHEITRYFPQQHLQRSAENKEIDIPTADDILKVYLDGLDKAEFKKK
ncbi:hypothetical protein G9A89_013295 [Geosiphon pyriformis]|nr:hypothetical protein G9A89_013295 [Geosiphon pyriformis]